MTAEVSPTTVCWVFAVQHLAGRGWAGGASHLTSRFHWLEWLGILCCATLTLNCSTRDTHLFTVPPPYVSKLSSLASLASSAKHLLLYGRVFSSVSLSARQHQRAQQCFVHFSLHSCWLSFVTHHNWRFSFTLCLHFFFSVGPHNSNAIFLKSTKNSTLW